MAEYKEVTKQEFKKFLEARCAYYKCVDSEEINIDELRKWCSQYFDSDKQIFLRLTKGNNNLRTIITALSDYYICGNIAYIELIAILRILGCNLGVEDA